MKTTTFDQIKTMLKGMSYSIFNRLKSLEAIVTPPDKPINHVYATDEYGIAKWMKRMNGEFIQPEWGYKIEVFIPETEYAFDYIPEAYVAGAVLKFEKPLVTGNKYIVTYDGVEYERVFDGKKIGNEILVDGADTGEPFLIYIFNDEFLLLPIDQKVKTAYFGLEEKIIKPIDACFIKQSEQ